jgi:hypothetical protein
METKDKPIIIINGEPVEQDTQDKLDAFLVSMQQGEACFFDDLYNRKEEENNGK